jgi:hypothetical protein
VYGAPSGNATARRIDGAYTRDGHALVGLFPGTGNV